MRQLKTNDVIIINYSGKRQIMVVAKTLKKDGIITGYNLRPVNEENCTLGLTPEALHMHSVAKVTKYKKQGRAKNVKLLSGLMGYQRRLQNPYADYYDFLQYSQDYNLSSKLGFTDPVTAWNINPVIQQGTNPDDYTTLAARIVKCYDNSETENATADCYTVINTKTGDGLSCSSDPFHPTGIGSNFNLVDNIMFHEWGAGWRTSLKSSVNRIIREKVRGYIKEAEDNPGWLGKEIQYRELPDKVKEYLHSSFEI